MQKCVQFRERGMKWRKVCNLDNGVQNEERGIIQRKGYKVEKRLYFRERGLELRKVYNLEKGVYSGEMSVIYQRKVCKASELSVMQRKVCKAEDGRKRAVCKSQPLKGQMLITVCKSTEWYVKHRMVCVLQRKGCNAKNGLKGRGERNSPRGMIGRVSQTHTVQCEIEMSKRS